MYSIHYISVYDTSHFNGTITSRECSKGEAKTIGCKMTLYDNGTQEVICNCDWELCNIDMCEATGDPTSQACYLHGHVSEKADEKKIQCLHCEEEKSCLEDEADHIVDCLGYCALAESMSKYIIVFKSVAVILSSFQLKIPKLWIGNQTGGLVW